MVLIGTNWKNCWQELEKIQQLNHLFPQLHYLRGLIYEKKGNLAQAKKEFIEEIKGGVIPKEYIQPINKGIQEAMSRGVLPVTNW